MVWQSVIQNTDTHQGGLGGLRRGTAHKIDNPILRHGTRHSSAAFRFDNAVRLRSRCGAARGSERISYQRGEGERWMGRVYRRLVTAAGLCGERFIFSGVNSVNSDVESMCVPRELQTGQSRCSFVLRNFRSKPNESIRLRTKSIPALDGCLRRLRYQRN